MAEEGRSKKGLGHFLKDAFNLAAKTAVIGFGAWAFVTLGEFTFLHSGLAEGYVISDLAREFFNPIFEATGITGWAANFDPEPIRATLKSVHEVFGITDSFAPKVLDVAADAVAPW